MTISDELLAQLRRHVFRIVRNYQDAEDVLQIVLEKIVRHSHKHDPSMGTYNAWAHTVARNTIFDYLNKTKARAAITPTATDVYISMHEPSTEDTADIVVQSLYLSAVSSALARLHAEHPRYYKILVLYSFHGYSQAEIAQQLNLNHSTLRSYTSKARLHMRRYMNDLSSSL